MNRLVSIAAAAAFTALAASGAAQAEMITGSNSSAIGSLTTGHYNLVRIDSLSDSAAMSIDQFAKAEAPAVQAAIRTNPTLVRDLKSQNVEIGNVVAADTAANGAVTFYLR